MTPTAAAPVAPARHRPSVRRPPGTLTVLRWELVKLAAQARSRWTLLACLVAPVVLVVVLDSQQRPPKDTLYGRYVHSSGLAVPLLVLAFAAQWLFPLLCALVAGDIFASEDAQGTWKTLLTRSVSRGQVFVAKTLVAVGFTVVALVVLATSTIVSSLVVVGRQPLVGLSGQLIAPGHALVLVVASWATALAPMVAFTALAVLLSVLTRNTALGVVGPVVLGLVMGLLGTLGGIDTPRRLLLTTAFESWHGLLAAEPFSGPLVTGLLVSAGWTAVCLTVAAVSLLRRDITGG